MITHILVPVDGNGSAQQAVEMTATLAKAHGAKVTLVSVIGPYPFGGVGTEVAYGYEQYLEAATSEARRALDEAQAALSAVGVTAKAISLEAPGVWRGILETAAQQGVDMIVMGSHGRSGLERMVLGSVTQRVLSHTKLPVLVVREP